VESFERAAALSRAPFFAGMLGRGYALSGRGDEANAILDSLDERKRSGEFIPSFSQWLVYIALKDQEATRRAFARVIEERTAPITISFPGVGAFGSDPELDRMHREYFGW
jgi:hypothetical protein